MRLDFIVRFLQFFSKATTQYGVHSPFVFEFCKKVLEDDRTFYAFGPLEALRQLMLQDTRQIEVADFGAGSKTGLGTQRKVSSIAHTSLTSQRFCQLLFRVVQLYQPGTILEMGTSLGLSTLYLAKGARKAQVITLEGSVNIARIAQENFQKQKAENIRLVEGHFDQTLPTVLTQLDQIDLAFIDGNHRYEPTLNYFRQCLEKCTDESILIFDDIYWSKEMAAAWEAIKAHPRVTLSIDLFFMGLVFFRPELKVKQHFRLVPKSWRPWRFGFFK